MPLPKPKKNESHDDFMERCMGNGTMNKEYPDEKQRYAVCQSQWDDKKGSDEMKETRSFALEIQKPDESLQKELFEKEKRKMVGHAAVFNEITEIGGWFKEQIEPGAFKASIKKDDVRALYNHNPDYVLGRSTTGTLTMHEDEKGLKVSIDPPDTDYAHNLNNLIARGDISQMSFSFQVLEEEWKMGETKKELDLRTIKKVRLFDVSPVTFPAYEGTDIAIRSHDAWRLEEEKKQLPPPIDEAWKIDILRKKLQLKIKQLFK